MPDAGSQLSHAEGTIVIRASSLSMYPDCMRRTAARLFPAEIRAAGFQLRELPPGIGAATGTACHAGAAVSLRAKRLTGEPGPAADAQEAAMASLDDEIARGVAWDATSPDRTTAQGQVLRQVGAWRTQIAPQITPIAVEERLEAAVAPGVVASGQVDVAVEGGVRDLKTGRVRRANGFQYGLYALLQQAHRRPCETLIEDFVPRAPISRPQPPAEVHVYDVGEAERAAMAIVRRMVGDLLAFVETGEPWSFLANPNSVLCSDRYCPAHSTPFCRAHKE